MFRKLFKKETSTEVVESEVPETMNTPQEEIPEAIIDDVAMNEVESFEPLNDELPEVESEPLTSDLSEDELTLIQNEPIQDEDFDMDFNLDDIGAVDDIDEEAMREELQKVIQEELMSEENLEAVEERAEMMETEMGITQHEWDTKYNNIEMLGYDNREQQALVFGNVLPEEFEKYEDSVLDVGCGVGDLFAYIQEVMECSEPLYTGIDLDPEMITLAKEKFPEIEKEFSQESLLDYNTNKKYDWVVAMSAFNVKVDGVDDMNEYIKKCIEKMYSLSNKGIALNLMHSFPKGEDWSDTMTTFDSSEIFKWAIDNYYNVRTHRNYIDRDFILVIYK